MLADKHKCLDSTVERRDSQRRDTTQPPTEGKNHSYFVLHPTIKTPSHIHHSACFPSALLRRWSAWDTHAASIKTSWEGHGLVFLDNLNQTNCFNASILYHYVMSSLSDHGCVHHSKNVCVWGECHCDCWASQTTCQIFFYSGKSAKLCQHSGGALTSKYFAWQQSIHLKSF